LFNSYVGPNTKVWFQSSPSAAKTEVEIIGKPLDYINIVIVHCEDLDHTRMI
jgi:hypothetical protein